MEARPDRTRAHHADTHAVARDLPCMARSKPVQTVLPVTPRARRIANSAASMPVEYRQASRWDGGKRLSMLGFAWPSQATP